MSDEIELLKKRFVELAKKSYNSGIFMFTDFLGLNEQSAFREVKWEIGSIKYAAFGGAEGAERVIVRFGSVEELGYDVPFPITTLKIEPISQKFSDKLTHRDFLGSILSLGIERRCLGDIVIIDNVGYVFALDDIAKFIADNLFRIKHTDVRISVIEELPEGELYRTESKQIQLTSERLDAVVAKVFSLSREDAQRLFSKGLVFADGRCIVSASYTPRSGERISVRGHGRMIYKGPVSLSKKGKYNVIVEVYV